jgi:hypothetical protein
MLVRPLAPSRMGSFFACFVGLVIAGGDAAAGISYTVILNDGLSHTIGDAAYAGDAVLVRNAGCAGTDDCGSPGAPTTARVVAGGVVGGSMGVTDSSVLVLEGGSVGEILDIYGESSLHMSGGTVGDFLYARSSSEITVSGGRVDGRLSALSAEVTLTGGSIGGNLSLNGSATVYWSGGTVDGELSPYHEGCLLEIVGSGFAVDGVPVPYGDLSATAGWLTGVLESGHTVENGFVQGGEHGTIRLVPTPEPTQTLLCACALVTLALLRRRAAYSSPPPARS